VAGEPEYLALTSPETREVEALGQHLFDLGIAEQALVFAIDCWDDEPPFLADRVLEAAALAYCRCFGAPAERKPLDSFVVIPARFDGFVRQLKAYRNRCVAHSSAEHVTTFVAAVVTERAVGSEIRMWPISSFARPPRAFVAEFAALVSEVLPLVHERLAQLTNTLSASLTLDEVRKLAAKSPDVAAWNPMTDRYKSDRRTMQWTVEPPLV